MRAVNLLPRDHGQRTIKKESLPVLVGVCTGLLVVSVLGAMFMMGSGKIASQQRKLDDLNRQFRALPPPQRVDDRPLEPRVVGPCLPRVLARPSGRRLADPAVGEVADLAGDEHVEHGRQHAAHDVHDPGPDVLA